jgi:hypothetical protein
MWTVAIFVATILVISLIARSYARTRYWIGHQQGMEDGADLAMGEAEQWFPWNASSELLYEWAHIRAVEEAVSGEAEAFLKSI